MAKHVQPRVFVTIAAPTLAAMAEQAASVGSSQVGYEWRLDYLEDHAGLETKLHAVLFSLRFPQSIATCRRVEAGGLFKGPVEEQANLLEAATRAGCHWVDLETEFVAQAGRAVLERFKNARVLVSFHDYRGMPSLSELHRRMARLPVQAVKIVGTARDLSDNLRIMQFVKSHHSPGPKLVMFAMGPSGIPSRALSLKWGSAFTYASAAGQQAVASGQLPVTAMRSLYRVERLDHRTQIYGVAGSHASLSLSPSMHNAAFGAKHVNAVYLPCESASLADFLRFARRLGFSGFSVTMPYKKAIMRELDWIDPMARQIGACNTVAVKRGRWMGWNTDAAAVVDVLTKRIRLSGSRVLVLGAGGAARAAAFALRGEGARVFIAARREAAGRQLAQDASAEAAPWELADGMDVDAVINATPIGMVPRSDVVPIDLARLRTRVVFDMVYFPTETRLLSDARGRGLIAISGLEMLVDQGARQFEIWTGESAPRALMEQAVRQGFDHAEPDYGDGAS